MLKTIDQNQLATAPAVENRVALALKSNRIIEMTKGDAMKAILEVISVTFFETGQKADDKLLAVLAKTTYEEVKDYFKWLRIAELKVAFASGTRGEYGEYFGLNIKTFHGWIKSYQSSEIRKSELRKKEQESAIEQPAVIDRSKVSRDYWKTVLNIFNAVRNGDNPEIPFAYVMINKLWKEGLIYTSKEAGLEYIAEAKRQLKEEAESFGRPQSKKESVQLLSMNVLKAAIETGDINEQQDRIIKARAAQIAILEHFALCDENHFRETIKKLIDRP